MKFGKIFRTPMAATFETKHTHLSAVNLLDIIIGNLNWNESHKKETNDIYASTADSLH